MMARALPGALAAAVGRTLVRRTASAPRTSAAEALR
jgi:hypothetical protein